MNNISMKKLQKLIPVMSYHNINEQEIFDYFYIVSLHNFDYMNAKNPLCFCTYADRDDVKNSWIPQVFDLRNDFQNRMKRYPNATFVIEEEMESKITNLNQKYIVVENIMQAIDSLFVYFKEKSQANVIAITGSVGKTTMVGLIEHILKELLQSF